MLENIENKNSEVIKYFMVLDIFEILYFFQIWGDFRILKTVKNF
jgi:hypothetical protein